MELMFYSARLSMHDSGRWRGGLSLAARYGRTVVGHFDACPSNSGKQFTTLPYTT